MRQKINEALKKFLKLASDKFSHEDLENLNRNIKTLKIDINHFKINNFFFSYITAGCYHIRKNKIIIDEEEFKSTIYHELFHMASSYYKDGIFYSGFERFGISFENKIINLGIGIDDCYTELLNRRYFFKDKDLTASYKYQIFITSKLEEIIGQKRMESLYLRADLDGLISDLEQYISKDEIMIFISDMDYIYKHLKDNKILFFNRKISNILNRINIFIVKVYLKKLNLQYLQNIIDYEEIMNNASKYINSIVSQLTVGENKFKIFSQEDLKMCCEYAFDECIMLEYKEKVKKYK